LLELGRDRLGAGLGITAVLHTWARDLGFHPHLHCIVTGGGLALDQSAWVATRDDYLFPYLVLSRLFRGKFLAGLDRLYGLDLGGDCQLLVQRDLFQAFKDRLYRKDWVAYQKPAFGGPEDVYRYLGRYTHRVAISNWRIETIDSNSVRFKTKHGQTATLSHEELIRRFLLHVLPKGFVKIRHYGLMASALGKTKLATARRLLEQELPSQTTTVDPPTAPECLVDSDDASSTSAPESPLCPSCGVGRLRRRPLLTPQARSP